MFPSLALLARPHTSPKPTCSILTYIVMDYATSAEIESGLLMLCKAALTLLYFIT